MNKSKIKKKVNRVTGGEVPTAQQQVKIEQKKRIKKLLEAIFEPKEKTNKLTGEKNE